MAGMRPGAQSSRIAGSLLVSALLRILLLQGVQRRLAGEHRPLRFWSRGHGERAHVCFWRESARICGTQFTESVVACAGAPPPSESARRSGCAASRSRPAATWPMHRLVHQRLHLVHPWSPQLCDVRRQGASRAKQPRWRRPRAQGLLSRSMLGQKARQGRVGFLRRLGRRTERQSEGLMLVFLPVRANRGRGSMRRRWRTPGRRSRARPSLLAGAGSEALASAWRRLSTSAVAGRA